MNRQTLRAVAGFVLVVVLALVLAKVNGGGGDSGGPTSAPTSHGSTASSGAMAHVAESSLPAQAQATLRLIDRGGPYPYPGKDGSVFGNFEGLLPPERSGYYHEYTVDTPGSSDRGTRRIITGSSGELYWTADHYESFALIDRGS